MEIKNQSHLGYYREDSFRLT